jgi:hypothetical protein
MRAEQFIFWIQGFFEISEASSKPEEGLSKEQVDVIKRHLALVFKYDIDPTMPDPTGELQSVHDGPNVIKPVDVTYRC